jgi:hypothetical protein
MSSHKNKNIDKRQLFIWTLIIVSTILIIGLAIWFIFIDIGDIKSNDSQNIEKSNQYNQRIDSNIVISASMLQGSYRGTRESIDGSIEAVLLQISDVNVEDHSFKFTINIGINKRFSGIGRLEPEKKLFKSDMIGDVYYSLDDNNKIILKSSVDGNNSEYKLVQEK